MRIAAPNIQIVSRYVPFANRAGHFTYLLELIRALHRAGLIVELDVLDPWFRPEHIPDDLCQIASVVIMPASYLQAQNQISAPLKGLRPLYTHLPTWLSRPLRAAWYRLRKQPIPGQHEPDAAATPAESAFVRGRVAHNRPDVLITTETFLGNILAACQDKSGLLTMNIAFDLHHQRQQQFRASGVSATASKWNLQKELDLLKAADIIVTIHTEDAVLLREKRPQAEVLCVPMATAFHPHNAADQIPGRCLFVGSDIEHNVHGLRWFLAEVWPHIHSGMPSAALHVCGTVCAKIDQTVPNVQLLGRVDQLDAEYAAAQVCLIPLVVGSGLKIKLVEALSHGRACVSTSVGIQGVPELADNVVLVADTPHDFARAVLSILTDAEKRRALEAEARRYVIEQLSPENVYQPFVEKISTHVAHQQQQKQGDLP